MGDIREITGCNVVIYDNGGPNGSYGPNRDDIITIRSADPANPAIEIRIIEMDIDCRDTLFFYNAASADPVYAVAMGSLGVPWYVGDHYRWSTIIGSDVETVICSQHPNMIVLGDWTFRSTVINPDGGAVSIRFKTNATIEKSGFKIVATCKPLCQPTYAQIDEILSIPPVRAESDGFKYINVCPYDTTTLVGHGLYPYNDYGTGGYHQQDDSSTFRWYIDQRIVEGVGLTSIRHLFAPGMGSDVRLEVTDHRGCVAMLSDYVRVRVSRNPIIEKKIPGDICLGDTLHISAGYSTYDNIILDTIRNGKKLSMKYDSLLYIPDGPSCPDLSDCYEASVIFSGFEAGKTITNVNDIISVCFTMEHSYLGDLQMSIVCPNMQAVITHPQNVGGRKFLGQAVDDAAMGTCVPGPIGVGWNYCWSDNSTLGFTYNGMLHTGTTTIVPGLYGYFGGIAVDSSNRVDNTKYYHPLNSFAGLIGCPLNGTWSLKICDKFAVDDGWIWSWELNLAPHLMPNPWSYSITMESVTWEGNHIFPDSDTSAYVFGVTPGTEHYSFVIYDEYQCTYEDDFSINIVTPPVFDIGNDLIVCAGTPVTLHANYAEPGIGYLWSTGEATESIEVLDEGRYTVTVFKHGLNRTRVCPVTDSIFIEHFPTPDAAFLADQTEACKILISHFSNETTPDNPLHVYSWNINTDPPLFSTLPSPVFTIDKPGNYDVVLVVENEFGCKDSAVEPHYLTVHAQPVAAFSTDLTGGCTPLAISLVNETSPSDLLYSCLWNIYDHSGIYLSDTLPGITIGQPGIYDIQLIVKSEAGCTDSLTIPALLHIKQGVNADFSATLTESCSPMTFVLINESSPVNPLCRYSWSINTTPAYHSSSASTAFTISEPGKYDVILTVENEFGCIGEILKPDFLTVHFQPVADFIADPESSLISEGGIIRFTNTSSHYNPADITWDWDFDDGEGMSNLESPVYVYRDFGEFDVTLFISNAFGCSSEVTRHISIDPEIEIPNILTPNNDGINDILAIKDLNTERENLLSIYDRWGRKVYEQKNYKAYMKDNILYNASSGFAPNELPNGTYYYTFMYKGYKKEFYYHGSLTILR